MRFLCSHCETVIEDTSVTFNEVLTCPNCEAETLAPTSRLALGMVYDDFVIMEARGEARIATRHLAYQLSLHREVILHILKRELCGHQRYRDQFVNNARMMARMLHPNIIHSYAIGDEDDVHFAATELVSGKDLRSFLIQEGWIPLFHVLHIAAQIAEALDYAWEEHRILHNDIKPGNIIWTVDGTAKLTGFRMAGRADTFSGNQEADEIVGSPPYLSPEQVLGVPMDIRSDIYSLGATLYHLLTGRIPYVGETPEQVAWMHLEEALVPPREVNPSLPNRVSELVERMMDKDIDARQPTAGEVRDELKSILEELRDGYDNATLPVDSIEVPEQLPSDALFGTMAPPKTVAIEDNHDLA